MSKMMMISSFLRVSTAVLALSLTSPHGHMKADDGMIKCATETDLLLEDTDVYDAYTNATVYWDSICTSVTEACKTYHLWCLQQLPVPPLWDMIFLPSSDSWQVHITQLAWLLWLASYCLEFDSDACCWLLIIVLLLNLRYFHKINDHNMIYPWDVSFPYDFPDKPIWTCSLCGIPYPADLFHELFQNKLFVFFARWCHSRGTCFDCFIMNWWKGFDFNIVICIVFYFEKHLRLDQWWENHAHKSMTGV